MNELLLHIENNCKAKLIFCLLWRTLSHPLLQEDIQWFFFQKNMKSLFVSTSTHQPKTKSFRYYFQNPIHPFKITFVFYHKFFLSNFFIYFQ